MVKDLSTHNKVHAFHGELIEGMPTLVHLPDDYFNLASQVQVPTLMSAKILLAANAILILLQPASAGLVSCLLSIWDTSDHTRMG